MDNDYVPLEKLLPAGGGSIYKTSILLAKRSLQLADGAKPLIDAKPSEKPIEVALQEIEEDKIKVRAKKKQKE